jgi:hypothetical protein
MTPVGFVLAFACAFFFIGLWLAGPLAGFLTPKCADGNQARLTSTDMTEPFAATRTFPAAGAAIPLGAMAWVNFDRRGKYLRPLAILLGVVLLSGLVAALCYRSSIQATFLKDHPGTGGYFGTYNPTYSTSELFKAVGKVPLVAAGVTVTVGAIMNAVNWWAAQRADPGAPGY